MKYNACLDKVAKTGGRRGSTSVFDCTGCVDFSKQNEKEEKSFEQELAFKGGQGMEKFQCLKCKEIKARDEFGSNASMANGRNKWCKKCVAKAAHDNWRKKHPDRPQRLRSEVGVSEPQKASSEHAITIVAPSSVVKSRMLDGDLAKAVEILIQHGFLSRAKLDAALELVKE